MKAKEEEPFSKFAAWMKEAQASEPAEAEACALATADADGFPNVRMVLVRNADADGFVFYTNLRSDKGEEVRANPRAALCFHWKSLARQVRVRGTTHPVSDAEADAYFAARPRGSRIGAWASKQSRPMEERSELEKRVADYAARYEAARVPRPEFWSGFRLHPLSLEFWQEGEFRLHERVLYHRKEGEKLWRKEYLFP